MAVPPSRYLVGSLPWYSVLIVLGASIAVFLAIREEKQVGLPKDTIIDLALWVLPSGILGGRVYYVLFSWSSYRNNPLSALYVWEGGMAIYGALIAGLIAMFLFCRRRRLSLLSLCDVVVPGVALAQSIGRWGNYFNREAYGLPLNNPTLCFFPLAVLIDESGTPVWHMATFFYESLSDFFVFILLIWGRRKLFRHRGDVFFAYLFLYGSARLVIENFRMDSLYSGGTTVRISQLLSVCICGVLIGLALLRFYREWKRTNERIPWIRKTGLVFSLLAGVYTIPLLLYCLQPELLSLPRPRDQLFFLAGYAASGIVGMLLLELPVRSSEVLYANNPA